MKYDSVKAMNTLDDILGHEIDGRQNIVSLLRETCKEIISDYETPMIYEEFGIGNIAARATALCDALEQLEDKLCDRSKIDKFFIDALADSANVLTAFKNFHHYHAAKLQDSSNDIDGDREMDIEASSHFTMVAKAIEVVMPKFKELCKNMAVTMRRLEIS